MANEELSCYGVGEGDISYDSVDIMAMDPGLKGGVAFLEYDLVTGTIMRDTIDAKPMPVMVDNKSVVDVTALYSIIMNYYPDLIVIEQAYDGGGRRSKGAKTIMANHGRLLAMAEYFEPSLIHQVAPITWQSVLKKQVSGYSDTKEMSVMYCEQILGWEVPTRTSQANSPKHDGLSDAVCMCAWACMRLDHPNRMKENYKWQD